MSGGRSNSFNFVPVRDVARGRREVCPLPANDDFADPARELWLRLVDRMRLYRTDTADFADAEVMRVKEQLGQVYADVSSKLVVDDFEADLKKLMVAGECRSCAHRADCGACWAPVQEPVFTRDDAIVRGLLRSLRGDVLDIGCGEAPYASEMAENVLSGRATYVGVDPDRARIGLLRSRFAWARYHVGTVESLSSAASFDHVLVLRSYNHLPDPLRTIRTAVASMRVGGTLLVVDNVAYGLVRGRRHAERAESGPGQLEHHRNDSSVEAHSLLQGLPLSLLARRDVGPASSNQWYLHYERTREGTS